MKKRLFALCIALVMVFAVVAGCAQQAPPPAAPPTPTPTPEAPAATPETPDATPETPPADPPPAAAGPLRIGYTTMDLANPYFIAVVAGMEQRAAELGVQLYIHDARQDAASQVDAIENWIVMQLDAIIITPFDGDALQDVVRRAHEAGIVLVNGNQEFVGHKDAFVTIPEYGYGRMIGVQAGRWIRDVLGGEAEFAVLSQPAIPTIVYRVEGIVSGILQYAPNAVFATEQSALTPPEGMAATETILLAHPNVEVIVGFNDSVVLGAYEAVIAAGRDSDRFFIGGVDAVPDAIERIKEGGIYRATVDIDPFGTGGVFLDTAISIINAGGPIPFRETPFPEADWVVIPMREVNLDNVFDLFG